jgi:type II secretory pathway component PulF
MASGPPLNLNYAPSVTPQRVVKPGYVISRLISSYIGYMLVMGILALIVPKFESVFSDFNVRLPIITIALIQASQYCMRCYVWLVCLPIPAMWALVNVSISDKYTRRSLRLAAFLFVVAFLIFTLAALFLPMNHLLATGSKAVAQ